MIYGCDESVVEVTRCDAIEEGLFVSNIFLTLTALKNQAVVAQIVINVLGW